MKQFINNMADFRWIFAVICMISGFIAAGQSDYADLTHTECDMTWLIIAVIAGLAAVFGILADDYRKSNK